MRKIGLFGGVFDPPHIGHLVVAQRSMEQLSLDLVIFVVANIPPHGKVPHASAQDRLIMVDIATLQHKNFLVSDYEIKKGGISYTIDTVGFFTSEFKDSEIFLIMGEDSAVSFNTWKDYKKIMEKVKLCWVPRIRLSEEIPGFIKINSEIIQISSTEIRRRIEKGLSIKWLVPDSVIDYIEKKKLYR